MHEAWCILGDVNAILYKEDRRGGDVTQDKETKEIRRFHRDWRLAGDEMELSLLLMDKQNHLEQN